MYGYPRYMDSRHITTRTTAFHISMIIIRIYVMLTCYSYTSCVISISLSYRPPCLLHVLLFHVTVFMLYDCFLLLIWIFPLLDMRAVDMQYVGRNPISIVPVSRYIVPVSRYIVLCYQQNSGPVIMLPVSCTVFVLVTLYT